MKTATNDKTMRESVLSELDWDAQIDAARIAVSAQDGTIVLSGHVPSYADKWAAVKAAERVYGVRTVADEIEVKLSGSSLRDDSDIAEDIARQLHTSTAIPKTVKAEVKNGYVTLRGEVEWNYQRTEAARTLRYLWGVQGLNNMITVKPKAGKSLDIEERVASAIERMAHLDARSIWVTSTNGTVHLHGHVHSFSEKHTAGLVAASAPGVTKVENDVLVTP
jgi:osmotically-inducible protein OsmY